MAKMAEAIEHIKDITSRATAMRISVAAYPVPEINELLAAAQPDALERVTAEGDERDEGDALEPCPFCGSEPEAFDCSEAFGIEQMVKCVPCGIELPTPAWQARAAQSTAEINALKAELAGVRKAFGNELQQHELWEDRAEAAAARLAQAMQGEVDLRHALEVAEKALADCGEVAEWPADGTSSQDAALHLARSALRNAAQSNGGAE